MPVVFPILPRSFLTNRDGALSAVALTLWCLVLLGPALHAGFRYDDAQHLQFAAEHAPWQYFSQRDAMLQLSYAHISPWNALFFDLGLPWFGLDARGHHAHLLLVLWAAALASWQLLRRWLDEPAAALGAALFLAMPATGVVGHMLMTGHYAWGLLFSILALHAFCRSVETGNRQLAWLAAACFAMACLCKELYVPLPLAWFALPLGGWRQRLRALLPALLVLAGYGLLRWHVLGGLGGYAALTVGSPGLIESTISALRRLAAGLGSLVFGTGPVGWLAMGLAATLLAAAWHRGRRLSAGLFWTTTAVVLAPVLPMFAIDLGYGFERLMLLLAWAVAMGLAWLARAGGRTYAMGLGLAVLLAIGQHGAVQATLATQQVMAAQNEFIVKAETGSVLVPDGFSHVGALKLMADAVRRIERREPARLVDDEEDLARLGQKQGERAFAWSSGCGCVRPLGPSYAVRVTDFQRQLETGRGRRLHGTLTLTDRGRYKLLAWSIDADPGTTTLQVHGFNRILLSASGQFSFGLDNGTRLGPRTLVRLALESAEGATTLTPWKELSLVGSSAVSWP